MPLTCHESQTGVPAPFDGMVRGRAEWALRETPLLYYGPTFSILNHAMKEGVGATGCELGFVSPVFPRVSGGVCCPSASERRRNLKELLPN